MEPPCDERMLRRPVKSRNLREEKLADQAVLSIIMVFEVPIKLAEIPVSQ
jgi:hypothetical protein